MGVRRLWLCVVVCCAVVCGVYGVPAQAKTVHVLAGEFGSEGSGAGQFSEPYGVAVNDTTHDVYVVDRRNDRVEEFETEPVKFIREFDGSGSPTGVFSEPTRIAVDNSGSSSAGDVYVVDQGHGVIDKFSATGTYINQITGRCEAEKELLPCKKSKPIPFGKGEFGIVGVAVDPTGNVWVVEGEGNIDEFGDGLENGYIRTCKTGFGGEGVGVDAEDDLYMNVGSYRGAVKVDGACGIVTSPFGRTGEFITDIAVDPGGNPSDRGGGEVYIDYGTVVEALSLGGSQIETFGLGDLVPNAFGEASRGVGVDGGNGTVYATDNAGDIPPALPQPPRVVIFNAITLPSVVLGPLSEQAPRSVRLNGSVNPEGFPVTSCVFEYVRASEYEPEAANPYPNSLKVECEPKPVGLGVGLSSLPVSGHLAGLVPEEKYDYRLVAENAAHLPSATENQEFTVGPVLGGEFVTKVTSESVTLNVPLDPNGDDTRYYFQFGPTLSYGFEVPVVAPGVDIGAVSGVQNVSVHVQTHLVSGTLYHYRVVVLQGGEEFFEPDHVFMTQSVSEGAVLVDGRAWELVSPPDKKGALIEPFSRYAGTGDPIQAASDGSGIAYLTSGPAVGVEPQGKLTHSQTLSVRVVGGGWESEDLSLPRRIPGGEEVAATIEEREPYQVFSPDLSSAVVDPVLDTPPLSPEAPEKTIYLRDDLHGTYDPLVEPGNVVNPEELSWGVLSDEQLYFVTATPDLGHVLLASPHAFTPEAVFEKSCVEREQWNLYEWGAGQLQLVNILPDGQPTNCKSEVVRLADGSQAEGNPLGVNPSAVSGDGRRVAWDLGEPRSAAGKYEGLFVRDMVDGSTVRVSPTGVFEWMSSDGSKVFFLEGGDLHLCEIVEVGGEISCRYSDLTVDHGVGEINGGVRGLVSDVSGDGSYVYFVATGVLSSVENAGGERPVVGGDNLYLLHDGGGVWSTSFIGMLGREDEKSWNEGGVTLPPDLSRISSRVSPDGRWLAFMSDRSLTGYDNVDAVSGRRDEEVFLYRAAADPGVEPGGLVCASCDPTGARPVGVLDQAGVQSLLVDRSEGWVGSWLAGSIPGWDRDFVEGGQYQSRYLSDSGRLFFDSPDGLVPHATNGLEDVFEYEPVGVGGCGGGVASGMVVYSGSSGGCVGLISSGISGEESAFLDASENGDDVFFVTAAKLVGSDYDKGYDVYDAHVCGSEGVACVSEPVLAPPCSSGDSCKAAPSPQPEIFGPAPSATFSGVGNVSEETKPKAKTNKKKIKKTKKEKKKRSKRAAKRARGKR